MERKKVTLVFVDTDSFGRDVFRVKDSKDLVVNTALRTDKPSWYTKYRNEFDGEPDLPLPEEHYDVFVERWPEDVRFRYMLLSRLQADCEYFLGCGGRSPRCLWAGEVKGQIAKMRELWGLLPQKPVWLTAGGIDEFEKKMATI